MSVQNIYPEAIPHCLNINSKQAAHLSPLIYYYTLWEDDTLKAKQNKHTISWNRMQINFRGSEEAPSRFIFARLTPHAEQVERDGILYDFDLK